MWDSDSNRKAVTPWGLNRWYAVLRMVALAFLAARVNASRINSASSNRNGSIDSISAMMWREIVNSGVLGD